MIETTNYKFKKPELADSPPDITVMNPNWDTADTKIKEALDGVTEWNTFKSEGGKIKTIKIGAYNSVKDIIGSTTTGLEIGVVDEAGNLVGGLGVTKSDTLHCFAPWNVSKDIMTLGVDSNRFKDLYLTDIGSVKAGINNKGDYESGTFTPVLYCSSGSSKIIASTTNYAIYNKIGKLIKVYFSVAVDNWDTTWASESVLLKGLPFVRDLNKWGVGAITLYTGMKTPVKALGITAHGTAHNSWWIRRQTDVTFGNLQLSYLEQAFTLEGWVEYTTV